MFVWNVMILSERNAARWRHDLDASTHKVMTCSLSSSLSYWCGAKPP
jgi:hypothetical protein